MKLAQTSKWYVFLVVDKGRSLVYYMRFAQWLEVLMTIDIANSEPVLSSISAQEIRN
jgi:hypothetical protein